MGLGQLNLNQDTRFLTVSKTKIRPSCPQRRGGIARAEWGGSGGFLAEIDGHGGVAASPELSSSRCQYTATHPVVQKGYTLFAPSGTNMRLFLESAATECAVLAGCAFVPVTAATL